MPNFKNSIHSEFENVLDFIHWCKTVEIFERVKGEKNCNEFLKDTFSSVSILNLTQTFILLGQNQSKLQYIWNN